MDFLGSLETDKATEQWHSLDPALTGNGINMEMDVSEDGVSSGCTVSVKLTKRRLRKLEPSVHCKEPVTKQSTAHAFSCALSLTFRI